MAIREITLRGTPDEQDRFTEVIDHYVIAKEDLDTRIQRKNGFNDADKFFASYLDETGWPYKALIFDPRPFAAILEKSSRLVGSKPRGRLVPREGGDSLGAYVNNELLSYQWDCVVKLGDPMVARWALMDMGARLYGAKFGIAKWRYETKMVKGKRKVVYDGPEFIVANSRDCLANPAYETVKNWFQHREYLTLAELENVNSAARVAPVYKNLDLLRAALREDEGTRRGGDTRDSNYQSENKRIRKLTDYMGRDETYKTIEVVTEYRADRWIMFAPKHGVILRDIPNPYDHGEIPVVMLRYYPLQDDLYGLSELEPVARVLRAINALVCQYFDTINTNLYPPLMINASNVRMHTIEFGTDARWIMNNPGEDVKRFESSTATTQDFQSAYSVLVGSLYNAIGEQSAAFSNLKPFSNEKTATEVQSLNLVRNARDNFNMIFLSEALKKQMMFWHSMNQQFVFDDPTKKQEIIRIVGKDAIAFFNKAGLDQYTPTQEESYQMLQMGQAPEDIIPTPKFPVMGADGEETTKFQPDGNGEGGNLVIEPKDLEGEYDYIPDIETMRAPTDEDVEGKLTLLFSMVTNPAAIAALQQEGKRVKMEEMLTKIVEATKVVKDGSMFFENVSPDGGMLNGQLDATGAGGATPGGASQGLGQSAGVGADLGANAQGSASQPMGGPPGVQIGG